MRPVLALLLLAATATPALAQRGDQMEAYRAMREGRIRPLGDILSRIPADRRRAFIGSEFAPGDRYRLKFMDRGAVSSVDYDARTGEVMNGRGQQRGFEGGRVPAYEDRRGYDDPRGGYDEDRARTMDQRRERAFEDQQRSYDSDRGDGRRGDGERRRRFRRY